MNTEINTTEQTDNPFKKIQGTRVLLPVFFGLGVIAWMFFREFDPASFDVITFTYQSVIFLLLAILCMVMRDTGYMIRIRVLADNNLSWWQAFRIIMLWEFTSAVTPSAVGGTSIAILYVNKEGISLGRSSAIVLVTSFLDELYFVLIFPLLILIVNFHDLFTIESEAASIIANSLFIITITAYTLKFAYAGLVAYGLFFNPRGLKWLLLQIFRLSLIRRWRHYVNEAGTEIIESSKAFKKKNIIFWLKAFGATFCSWTARYWVVNALLLAFFVIPGFADHFIIFARQLVMWIMQLISPTPGGSGFAEYVFTQYLGDFIPVQPELVGSVALGMALLWRIVSYYPYLIIGTIILPKWIRTHFNFSKN